MDQTDTSASTSEPDSPGDERGDLRGFEVELIDPGVRLPQEASRWVRRHAEAAAAHLDARGELRVRLVGDPEMADAHVRFSGVEGTTDVLTFDLLEGTGAEAREVEADVLVCVDTATREAAARRHAPEHEVLLYIIHALLHCLGHDDQDEQAAIDMHRIEDETLCAIGVGSIYATRGSP